MLKFFAALNFFQQKLVRLSSYIIILMVYNKNIFRSVSG